MAATIEHIDFHGLPALRLRTAGGAAAVVSLHGAQVLSWTPPGGAERLYLSPQAVFDGRTPIRGGIPVCFPQFADLGELAAHGFARTATWSVLTERTGDEFALLTLGLADDEATRAVWPHPFRAELGTVFKYLEDGLSKSPVWITEKLVFLGEIPRENDFEALSAIGDIVVSGKQVPDFSIDDSALCYMANDGLVIITGCSHSGICNIIEYGLWFGGDGGWCWS